MSTPLAFRESPGNDTPAGDAQEAGALARELTAAFQRGVEFHKRHYEVTALEALTRAQTPAAPEYEDQALYGPADEVSWHTLEYLAERDPALVVRRWEEIKREARDELCSGHRAAKVMEGGGSHCWERAQFLAIRRDLLEAWQPRNGVERQLIDTLAQAQTAQLY
jgi:hypothetical protein